jgi:hypothetical protein
VNRKIILLNLGLLALAGWFCWILRAKWNEAHQHEHTELSSVPRSPRLFAPPPVAPPKPMAASEYNDVAQKTLFAKDRNPNVIIEVKAPPPLPPPPPMPPLPAYFGSMSLGDPVIVLRLPKGTQKSYHAGDEVGPFKVVSFDHEKVVFDWDGKTVERNLEDLREKEEVKEVAVNRQVAPVAPAAAAPPGVSARSIGGSASNDTKEEPKGSDKLGRDLGPGLKACVAGDTSVAGTVVDGYKKRVEPSMMGPRCLWEQANP